MVSAETLQFATPIIIAVAALVIVYVILSSFFDKDKGQIRQQNIAGSRAKASLGSLSENELNAKRSDQKRKEIQAKLLKQEKEKKASKASIQQRLLQAGLGISPSSFYLFSFIFGAVLAFIALITTSHLLTALGVLFVATLGLPLWLLGFLQKRRRAAFLTELPNAIDVVVRGVKSGLPLNDAIKMISEEASEPLRSEFLILAREQKMGVTIQEGIFRMNDRIDLPELNFLAIVITIQQTMGGNLSETLSGLSKIIRDRKKMRGKIDAMATEAKSSAMIIGALPFLIMAGVYAMSPDYMMPMFTTDIGKMLLLGAGFWMLLGVFVMKQMINLKI